MKKDPANLLPRNRPKETRSLPGPSSRAVARAGGFQGLGWRRLQSKEYVQYTFERKKRENR